MTSAAGRTKGELVAAEAKEMSLMAGGALPKPRGCVQRGSQKNQEDKSARERLSAAAVAMETRARGHQCQTNKPVLPFLSLPPASFHSPVSRRKKKEAKTGR